VLSRESTDAPLKWSRQTSQTGETAEALQAELAAARGEKAKAEAETRELRQALEVAKAVVQRVDQDARSLRIELDRLSQDRSEEFADLDSAIKAGAELVRRENEELKVELREARAAAAKAQEDLALLRKELAPEREQALAADEAEKLLLKEQEALPDLGEVGSDGPRRVAQDRAA